MSVLDLQIYELFKKHFSEEEAKQVITYIDIKVEERLQLKKDVFLTKDDKVEIIKSIYNAVFTSTIIQFFAIVGSLIALLKFMLNK
ncbi:MAG: hypothetical protein EBX41_08075 [Chitinophagia bacterium]|nr:hypothetical protein [Chitinophagia bacterium]